jgi:hypothetical protein
VVSQSASLNVALAVQMLAGFLDELNRVSPTVQLEASEHLIIWIRKNSNDRIANGVQGQQMGNDIFITKWHQKTCKLQSQIKSFIKK